MSVVFTDSFTNSGSDARLDQWPSAGAPDYSYMAGATTAFTVNAANDRVQNTTTGAEVAARLLHAGMPTGDQQISATMYSTVTGENGVSLMGRCSASAFTGYLVYCHADGPGEALIYRVVAGAFSAVLAQSSVNAVPISAFTGVLKITGAGATVSIEFRINGTLVVNYDDTNAARLTSGVPGFHAYSEAANISYIDDISVDDLAAGGATPHIPNEPISAQLIGHYSPTIISI